jgi:hypothetical protein
MLIAIINFKNISTLGINVEQLLILFPIFYIIISFLETIYLNIDQLISGYSLEMLSK